MRAIFIEKYGPPKVLSERSIDTPEPSAGEIRVRVLASGVNFADLLQRLHLYGNAPERPYIPGFEVSGTISAVGSGGSEFTEGDRVVALTRFGGYAEEVCVLEKATRKVPEKMDLVEAASIPVNFLTAYFPLFRMANLRSGERVLIHGGAGGVGSAAIQLAREHQTTIFATAGSEEKVEFMRTLGADYPINYEADDFSKVIDSHTEGQGVDVILDGVGGKTLKESIELLAPLGRAVSYGLSSAVSGKRRNWLRTVLALLQTPRFAPLDLIGRNIGVFGFHLALLKERESEVEEAFKVLLASFEKETLRTVVDRTFPLSRKGAVSAHHYLHERRNQGKVLLVRET